LKGASLTTDSPAVDDNVDDDFEFLRDTKPAEAKEEAEEEGEEGTVTRS
jgi:hypothetical protein